jgi:hypothetical protein
MAWDREYDSAKREWIGEGNPNLVGWMIVADGDKRRIKEVKGEHKIFDLAQNDDDHPTQIYWTREAAEAELAYSTDPVGTTIEQFKAGELDVDEMRWRLGDKAARAIIEEHG